MSDNNIENNKDADQKPQYTPLLSDDDGSAQPVRRRKKDPMVQVRKEIEEQQRQQREKAELLKLRQGLIDESDEIPEEQEPPKYEKPKGWKAIENFFYHYKWTFFGSIFAVALATFLTVQIVTREQYDLYVLAISTSSSSGIFTKTDDIAVALERYCPDFDGNGYVHVAVNYIDLSTESGYSQYTDVNEQKFSAELFSGNSQFYIADEGIIAKINTFAASSSHAYGETIEAVPEDTLTLQFFTDYTEKYPDAVLFADCGIQVNQTPLADEARWKSCPDTVGIYVREEFQNMTGNSSEAIEQRRRANIVLENIMNNNIVNPDWHGKQ